MTRTICECGRNIVSSRFTTLPQCEGCDTPIDVQYVACHCDPTIELRKILALERIANVLSEGFVDVRVGLPSGGIVISDLVDHSGD